MKEKIKVSFRERPKLGGGGKDGNWRMILYTHSHTVKTYVRWRGESVRKVTSSSWQDIWWLIRHIIITIYYSKNKKEKWVNWRGWQIWQPTLTPPPLPPFLSRFSFVPTASRGVHGSFSFQFSLLLSLMIMALRLCHVTLHTHTHTLMNDADSHRPTTTTTPIYISTSTRQQNLPSSYTTLLCDCVRVGVLCFLVFIY